MCGDSSDECGGVGYDEVMGWRMEERLLFQMAQNHLCSKMISYLGIFAIFVIGMQSYSLSSCPYFSYNFPPVSHIISASSGL